MGLEIGQHGGVVGGFDHDGDVGVVLGGGADHRGAADIDVLDAVVIGLAGGDGRLERVEVDDEQVDRRDAVAEHRGLVLGMRADGEQAAMHLGMQRLDAAVHHLGEAGQIGDIRDGEAGIGDRLGGAAGRDQSDAQAGEGAGEVDQPGLVGNGKQRAFDAAEFVRHGRMSPG